MEHKSSDLFFCTKLLWESKKIIEVIREEKMEQMKATKDINVEQIISEWEKHQGLWNMISEEYKDCIK